MAKQFGSLVGTPRQANHLVGMGYEKCTDHIIVRDKVLLAAAAADTVQCCLVGWESILSPGSKFWFDDLGTGGTVSLGDVTYPNALANAVNTDSAAGSSDALAAVAPANYFKPLWQMLGYATLAAAQAVGAQCEMLFTRNTAAGAGNMAWQITGQPR